MIGYSPAVQNPESGASALRRKARLGVVILALRTVVVQLTVLGGNIYLYRLLRPEDFGAFAIVQFALSFLVYFGDAGLGGALIQKSDEPTKTELSTVWLLQIGIGVAIVGAVWGLAPTLVRFWPDMDESGAWLFRALSLQLLLTALRVVPAILMERHLQYTRLALLDVALSVGFYVGAVVLAMLGLGVKALIGGVLIQGTLGVLIVFLLRPWRPSMVFDWKAVRPLLNFGLYFQAKNILGFVNGAIGPVYAGHTLGQRDLGHLTWAQNTAFFPLQLVGIISRINFPLYSRLQSNREELADVLGRSVQLTAMATLLFCGLVGGLGPKLVVIVFTEKWLPALPLLYVYLAGISVGFLAPLVSTALDATGRARLTFRFSLVVVVLTWTLVPIGTHYCGIAGFAVAYIVVMWMGNLAMIWFMRRIAATSRLPRRVLVALVSATLVGFVGYALRPAISSWVGLVLAISLQVLVFGAAVFLLDRAALIEGWSIIANKRAAEETSAAQKDQERQS